MSSTSKRRDEEGKKINEGDKQAVEHLRPVTNAALLFATTSCLVTECARKGIICFPVVGGGPRSGTALKKKSCPAIAIAIADRGSLHSSTCAMILAGYHEVGRIMCVEETLNVCS